MTDESVMMPEPHRSGVILKLAIVQQSLFWSWSSSWCAQHRATEWSCRAIRVCHYASANRNFDPQCDDGGSSCIHFWCWCPFYPPLIIGDDCNIMVIYTECWQQRKTTLVSDKFHQNYVLVITHDFQEKVITPDFQILFKQISDIITGVEYPPPR